jgi:hypothetical protein
MFRRKSDADENIFSIARDLLLVAAKAVAQEKMVIPRLGMPTLLAQS